ncbi:hypothetical protein [Sodalis ligni]|uniref:Uncharacterized protein n=1 Tax=Sodalis ligni TaxID=2697027 RepID=A0A4R1NF64_9GAMM|nr:hypothetical protein [Sodalis ligni]TCL06275.1 hypothetical protein EZJ58_4513 [Sodalis ligni]
MENIFAGVVVFSLLVSPVVAEELSINGQPLTITANDGQYTKLRSCQDFIAFRQAGKQVKYIPNLNDPDWRQAKRLLTQCYINFFTTAHHLHQTQSPKIDIEMVVKHFPAYTKLSVSYEEREKVNKQAGGKSLLDFIPDLIPDGNGGMASKIDSSDYGITNTTTYKDNDDHQYIFLNLGTHLIGGTLSVGHIWLITNMKTKLWDVDRITENNPL